MSGIFGHISPLYGILRKLSVCAVVLLVGCETPLRIPTEIRVAVPTPCLSPADRPERPALLTDAEILALDTYRATWALWGDRLERQGYESRMEAAIEGCSRIPAVTP